MLRLGLRGLFDHGLHPAAHALVPILRRDVFPLRIVRVKAVSKFRRGVRTGAIDRRENSPDNSE